jgi:dienelactone hydrolase
VRRLLLALVLLLAACGGSSASAPAPLPAELAHRFDYDRAAPIGLVDRGVANHDYPVKIHDVTFPDRAGGRIAAYLMVPPGKGPFAGVVLVPGSGGTRDTFLIEGADLAARGAVVLSFGSRFVTEGSSGDGLAGVRAFRSDFAANVIDLRRAFDLLAARPDVDPNRLGLLGHSLGAALDGTVAGADDRVSAVVLIAPPRHPHFVPPVPAAQEDEILRDVDPTRFLPSARAKVLLAFASHDQVIPRSEYDAYAEAAPEGRTVRWYDTDHHMSREAVEDTLDWLAQQLRLGRLPAYAGGAG